MVLPNCTAGTQKAQTALREWGNVQKHHSATTKDTSMPTYRTRFIANGDNRHVPA